MEVYRHYNAEFTVPIPPDWERVEDPQDGIALVTVEPPSLTEFRTNAVITVEPVGFDLPLEKWQAAADTLLAQQMPNYGLIDRELTDVDGRRFVRRLSHYFSNETGSVTMEQWAIVSQGKGFTFTASVATLAYDRLADTFAEMAMGFTPDEFESEAQA